VGPANDDQVLKLVIKQDAFRWTYTTPFPVRFVICRDERGEPGIARRQIRLTAIAGRGSKAATILSLWVHNPYVDRDAPQPATQNVHHHIHADECDVESILKRPLWVTGLPADPDIAARKRHQY